MPRVHFRFPSVIVSAFLERASTLNLSLNPKDTLLRLSRYQFTIHDTVYVFHFVLAAFWITIMQSPPFPYKLLIPLLYAIVLLVPLTSQFFVPATPIFAYLLTFYTSRFIPEGWRPPISVSTLPALESVLYGANISDILTRFTHPALDILAWIPYGVGHFSVPFVVAAVLWLFGPKPALKFFAQAFGYMNLIGVIIQIVFPCAAPWYELIHGLTPANYSMKGSPGGLARIDKLFHSHGYTVTFSNSPVVFGAFPSLHSACATMEALFISHFFPHMRPFAWGYAGILYWATMYLTHHYLIDVVSGACLAVSFFYFFLPLEFKDLSQPKNKYELYDLEAPQGRPASPGLESELSSDEDVGQDITYRSPRLPNSNTGDPLIKDLPPRGNGKSHRHTASIASLIRSDNNSSQESWGPIGSRGFAQERPTNT